MKAIVYNGPCDVSVKNVTDAKIEKPTDVLIRITTTNICGRTGNGIAWRIDPQRELRLRGQAQRGRKLWRFVLMVRGQRRVIVLNIAFGFLLVL
jgi:hypothetical protein